MVAQGKHGGSRKIQEGLASIEWFKEKEFGMGFQMERGIRVNPLSRCPLSGKLSKEDNSASRVEVKGGLTGRVGFDPRGYSDMGSPSNSIIRGKGLIFEGPDSPLTNPSGPILPNSVPLPQSPTENQGISKFFYEKGGVDYLNHGDIPDRVEEENQCALSNQMSESCTPKDSIVRCIRRFRVISLLMACPPGKWPKCERYYALLTLRCILGGRAEAPQGIETCWFWLGRLGSLCFPMKIISWNVRGLGSRNKRRMVKDFLRSENPDVVMIQETKKEIVIEGLQEALIRRTSDHWPIVMDTNPFMWGPTPFRFENMWLQHTNFKENFRDWWSGFQGNGWEGHKFMRRLQYVKAKLKEWNKFSFGELKEKKKSILNDLANFDAIEQEGGLNPDLLSQRASRKGELEELILREEIHWRQKAKVKWVKEGDCNSKFYHKVANGRRNRKYIKELENERGESWGVEGLDWSPISEESALRDKAPGPDGFTIAVFQECWDVIKEDLVRVFAEFHRSGIINQSTNASFIVLIPKKSLSKRISDFRPISLITSLYKIIAKVLSGRLRGVLHETIHYTQGAFVQGRQILDAVLIANEIVDERRRSGEEGVVFKIDFEKAYDHVKWDFLDHVLEKKGFSPRWRKWMSGCLSSVSYAILVNGSAKGWVKASRGLRQGDPLSPFLFTLVADVLSRMLMRAEERNMMEGFRGGRAADSEESFVSVWAHFWAQGVWMAYSIWVSLWGNPKACGFWDPVVERISSRLDGWQKAYLSFGGRITLIQSCLTHLPSYFLSLFKMPASVAAKIERLQRDFLWSGVGEGKRDHLVRWDVVCKPKTIGGLGLGNISWRNLALLGKWLWRYPREGSALWHQVILSIYGSHSNGWDANTLVRWSHRCPWKAIAQVFQEFSLITRYVVGNGERIRFWEDLWGGPTFGNQYPRLFRVVVDKNISISSVLGPSRPFLWNLNFRRNLSDSEIEDLEGLMRSLDDLYLSPSVPDARLWPLSSSGLFSVKSFFLALSQSSGSSELSFKVRVEFSSSFQSEVLCLVSGTQEARGISRSSFSSLFLDDWVVAQRGIVLWQAASIALIRVVWWERNARIFEDKARNSEFLWDSIVFLASLWAFCSKAFKGIPLNVIQLDWIAVCTP
ncbi:Transposon TX1 uncharacterized 149 kDa protein [Vitis vinifera]|uniref:Transposon TX1 uncharacterized 149 kDa protein n=1 Tax=Vitis vinifera TaxID=29760 RepID=A0A438DVP9_VITVI|nr:Transposon TX1 uncharacterized 149 kDa protein [Vitis vinifera]